MRNLSAAIESAPSVPPPAVREFRYIEEPDPTQTGYDSCVRVRATCLVRCAYPVPATSHPLGYYFTTIRVSSVPFSFGSSPTPHQRQEAIEAALDNLLDILRYSFIGCRDINRDTVRQAIFQESVSQQMLIEPQPLTSGPSPHANPSHPSRSSDLPPLSSP